MNSDLINPAKLYAAATPARKPWAAFIINLHIARQFHQQVGAYYHPFTRAYYGADPNYLAWGNARWRTHDLMPGVAIDFLQGSAPNSNGTGSVTLTIDKKELSFKLDGPDARGDGTVPADASGHDPATSPHVQQCYRLSGFDHQFSYNDAQVRLTVLHSLAKLVQRSTLLMKA